MSYGAPGPGRWITVYAHPGHTYLVIRGRRYDTGDKADYLRTIVQLAADRADLGPGFRAWLADFAATRLAAGPPDQPIQP